MVLMGDAAATAHFSIGSGTKLALESAIALADYLHTEPTWQRPSTYEDERRLEVLRLQSAARNSLEWFEEVERYLDLDPVQFNYSLLTRSQRISHENLRLRDPEWLEDARALVPDPGRRLAHAPVRAPMFAPFKLRDMELKNRIVVSPMAQYKAVDGCPTDWHLVHYGERAKGGAGLVYTEMTCVSPKAGSRRAARGSMRRSTRRPGSGSSDFVHAETRGEGLLPDRPCRRQGIDPARLGRAWMHRSRWQLAADVGLRCGLVDRQPDAQGDDRADMDQVRDQFVAAAEMAERAGFDMIELHWRMATCCRPSSRR
jgi:anthraniloyl-CoA monooxygenase